MVIGATGAAQFIKVRANQAGICRGLVAYTRVGIFEVTIVAGIAGRDVGCATVFAVEHGVAHARVERHTPSSNHSEIRVTS